MVHRRLPHVGLRYFNGALGSKHLKNLAEAGTIFRDALSRLLEWQTLPGLIVSYLARQISDVFSTRGTRHPTQWFLGKHGVLLVLPAALLVHEQVEESLDLLLNCNEALVGIFFVGEAVDEATDNVIESLVKSLLQDLKVGLVGLLVKQGQELPKSVVHDTRESFQLSLQSLQVFTA